MIAANALVVYKNKPALVKEFSDGKYSITLQDGEQFKVREKDIELVHSGPVKDFSGIEIGVADAAAREIWELLLDDGGVPVSLKDLAGLLFGEYNPSALWSAYCLLKEGIYFSGTVDAVVPRSKDEVTAEQAKRTDKLRETDERAQFLARIKACLKKPSETPLLPDDSRFIQDIEALALGKSVKSRTMKELGLGETPEEAHALLLKTGFWTYAINPHPSRLGLSLGSAGFCPDKPPDEERRDLCHLAAFAIDSPWSNDPDDAVSIEITETGKYILYVHVADPAASVMPDSPAEKEARDRGATLYLPENTVRMLAEESLSMFVLGLSEKSFALTFKITLDENNKIIDTEIFPSVVNVKRMTYQQADCELDAGNSMLCALLELAQRNCKRRTAAGAANIELPEVRIYIEDGIVKIDETVSYRSAFLVRECMIIAGEGAGTWAAGNGLVIPYISQEVEIQDKISSGLAGSWQMRRCMRPRVLSTKPGKHQGLGLEIYTQVTSPLRRYTDLLVHIQIRSFLRGNKTLCADEISRRIGFSEAASAAVSQAERVSNNHWTMVYLSGKKDSVWDAVVLDSKGNRWVVIIPALALETQVSLQKNVSPNDNIQLLLKSVNIPRGEAVFVSDS
jgi:exoribonuclease-2